MLILWSGGLDSTWILHRALLDAKPSESVRTISLRHPQISGCQRCWKARNELIECFRKRGYGFPRIEIDIEVSTHVQDQMNTNHLLQPLFWLQFALLYAADGETIQFGYVSGDDAIRHLDRLQHIAEFSGSVQGKTFNLEFPLSFVDKYKIVNGYKKEIPEFLENIWYCQNDPKKGGKPCGTCHSCLRHKTALWQAEQKDFSEIAV